MRDGIIRAEYFHVIREGGKFRIETVEVDSEQGVEESLRKGVQGDGERDDDKGYSGEGCEEKGKQRAERNGAALPEKESEEESLGSSGRNG